MHNRTKQFMSRLRERAEHLEAEFEDRIAELLKRPEPATEPQINTGPDWIDTSNVKSHTRKKGSAIDFLVGKTKVKSYNQRGAKS